MNAKSPIPVVDVDNAFPAMVERPGSRRDVAAPGDVGPQVTAALRDILGWRPRVGDVKAFDGALTAAFRLSQVEGHVKADYVPRGYAVQADLGAVTGGQASLYRRALLARTEALRILDGLTPLRPDADVQDMEAYRLLVRNGVERVVDEIGAAGGPRVQMVDMYFAGLTGAAAPVAGVTADGVAGQLGALRDRFGLIDGNVNSVEEEGVRTAYWTLVDLIADLQGSWSRQVQNFSGGVGQGFLGTELIILSRLMEAAAEQVEELEDVLDSVLIALSERRTLLLDNSTGLTLDGLLAWIHDFLSNEGRRIAQDGGRDGIVSGLAPMAVALVKTFKSRLSDQIETYEHNLERGEGLPVAYLPASCCSPLPAGMYAARTRIAVASLCRLLMDLARSAQSIGRWAQPVLLNVTFSPVKGRSGVVEVELRGFNLRSSYIPAFATKAGAVEQGNCLADYNVADLIRPLEASSTATDENVTALFDQTELAQLLNQHGVDIRPATQALTVAAEALPLALIEGESGLVVSAPGPVTWPGLIAADRPPEEAPIEWKTLAGTQRFRRIPADPVTPAGVSFAEALSKEEELAQLRRRFEAALATHGQAAVSDQLSDLIENL